MKTHTTRKLLLAIVLIIAHQNIMSACSCSYHEPVFCKNFTSWYYLARVVVTEDPDIEPVHLMTVALLENMNKEIPTDTFTIYGQDGLSCGELLTEYNKDDTLILALTQFNINIVDTFYFLEFFCGDKSLRYENGLVLGQITETDTVQTIEYFRDHIMDCMLLSSIEDIDSPEEQLQIHPNPVSDNLHLSLPNLAIEEYQIFNANGQLISTAKLNKLNDVTIDTNDFGNGIYYIRVVTAKGILTRRFLKVGH